MSASECSPLVVLSFKHDVRSDNELICTANAGLSRGEIEAIELD